MSRYTKHCAAFNICLICLIVYFHLVERCWPACSCLALAIVSGVCSVNTNTNGTEWYQKDYSIPVIPYVWKREFVWGSEFQEGTKGCVENGRVYCSTALIPFIPTLDIKCAYFHLLSSKVTWKPLKCADCFYPSHWAKSIKWNVRNILMIAVERQRITSD